MCFECKKNCGECCGMIPFPKILAKKTEHLAQVKPTKILEADEKSIYVITEDMKCVYLNRETKECAIYGERPRICRLYGLIPACACPYFDLNGRKRGRSEIFTIQNQINQTVNKALELAKQNVQTVQ